MMFKVSCVLVLVCGIHAISVNPQNVGEMKQTTKKGCCLPPKYTVMMADTVYQNNVQTMMFLDYATDSDTKMIAYRVWTYEGKLLVRGVQDYNKRATYFIQNNMCTSTPLNDPWVKQCIPDDAKYLTSSYAGLNPQGFVYNVWMMTEQNSTVMAGLDKTCFPVMGQETAKLAGNDMRYTHVEFYNGTAGITDPSMFDVPSSCAAPAKGDMPEMSAINERKRMPHSIFRK